MAMTPEGKAKRIASLEARQKATKSALDTAKGRVKSLTADLAEITADLDHVRSAPVRGGEAPAARPVADASQA